MSESERVRRKKKTGKAVSLASDRARKRTYVARHMRRHLRGQPRGRPRHVQQVEQRAAPHPLGDQAQRLVRLKERVAEELHHARVLELAEKLPLLYEAAADLMVEGLRGIVRV